MNNSGYGIRVVDTSGIVMNRTKIYGKIDYYFYVENSSTFDTHDLWLGRDERVGILWPAMKFDQVETEITKKNLILGEDFVSLNASDPLAKELNETARITIVVPGCFGIRYYNLDGFPGSKEEIMTNGTIFSPSYSSCAGTLATFEVAGFSGYTANGSTPSPSPPSGGNGNKWMEVAHELICPENVLKITITSGGEPVSDAKIRLLYDYGPYSLLIRELYTDGDGIAEFDLTDEGDYEIIASKSGYRGYEGAVSITLCEEEQQEEVEEEIPEEKTAGEQPVETEGPKEQIAEEEVVEEHKEEVREEQVEQPEKVAEEAAEGQPAVPEEAKPGQDLCTLSLIALVTVAIAAAAYYWLVLRKRK